MRSRKLIESRPLPPRRRYFVSVLLQVAIFAGLSILTAHFEWVPIFSGRMPPPRAIAAGFVFLIIAVAFGWTRWRKAVAKRERIVALFMPTDNFERAMWIGCALLAGIGEEITWRGVQTTLLMRLTGNTAAAIAIAIVMFAIAHAIQGWKSVGVIAVFAAGFYVLVWLAGSLYVAIVVHVIYDLIAGFSYGYLGKKSGYAVEEVSVPVPATDPA